MWLIFKYRFALLNIVLESFFDHRIPLSLVFDADRLHYFILASLTRYIWFISILFFNIGAWWTIPDDSIELTPVLLCVNRLSFLFDVEQFLILKFVSPFLSIFIVVHLSFQKFFGFLSGLPKSGVNIRNKIRVELLYVR